MSQLIVKPEFQGQRLDKFLFENLSNFSRSQIQKQIKTGQILVNKQTVAPHYFLKDQDQIDIKIKKTTPQNNQELFKKIKIIAETPDYLIIFKPSGLLIHPDGFHKEKTLVDWLVKKYQKIKTVYDQKNQQGPERPGIVHRLDREVSGLLVVAKNQTMLNHLKNQFQERQVKKNYSALVYGELEPDHGFITRPLRRSSKTGLIVAKTTLDPYAKEALTEFEVLERYQNYTLLKIILHTGRTHQIRTHLKSIGHSVVGDSLYQTRNVKFKKIPKNFTAIFLCATELGFKDLTGNWQEFKISLPSKLKNFLKEL